MLSRVSQSLHRGVRSRIWTRVKSTRAKAETEDGSRSAERFSAATVAEEIEDDSVQLTGQGLLPATTTLEIVNTLDMENGQYFVFLEKRAMFCQEQKSLRN